MAQIKNKYIIGTGWWCDGSGKHRGSLANDSSDEIREKDFFDIWYNSIIQFSHPEKILIIDSDSPVKPDLFNKNLCIHLNMIQNFGHPLEERCFGKMSGWERSLLLGLVYTYFNDIPYFVYVEQDCIINGNEIIEASIENMKGFDYSHGLNKTDGFEVECSFVIIDTRITIDFIKCCAQFQKPDKWQLPEVKWVGLKKIFKYTPLLFGYGRERPIDFTKKFWYAQHLKHDELVQIKSDRYK